MKYIVSRTSDNTNPPCEGAVKEQLFRGHIAFELQQDWTLKGIMEEYEYVTKDKDGIHLYKAQDEWVVEIPDLLDFAKMHGDIIVIPDADNDQGLPEVEIYDTYRE